MDEITSGDQNRTIGEGRYVVERLLFTPEEVAEMLSLGRSTIYVLMASGALGSVRVGRSRRVPAAAVREYVELLMDEAVA